MRRLGLLLLVLASCRSPHHGGSPPTYDYRPPTWVVTRALDGTPDEIAPTLEETRAEIDRVSACWLAYWQRRGAPRPPNMPPPGQPRAIRIVFAKSCTTSGDTRIDGGLSIKSWSCTRNDWEPRSSMISWVGHGLSHMASGCGGGNACHELFQNECGV